MRDYCQTAFARQKVRFRVCTGTACIAGGSLDVYEEFKRLISEKGIDIDVELTFKGQDSDATAVQSGCHGFCQMGPLVRVEPQGTFYIKVKVSDVPDIISATLDKKTVVEELLFENPDGTRAETEHDVPFYNGQKRIVLGRCGTIDPEDIRNYFAVDGYQALAHILQNLTPEEVVEAVKESGLRGRGGGGFPTGRKWESASKANGKPKYIICNADEGDPEAFMDRSLCEGNPQAIIEGMIISAYGVGALHGVIYVRAEYPLAVIRLAKAIDQARQYRVLGDNIMGTGFNFDIEIFQGAGAFVCGESSALRASIEGLPGEPTSKYDHATDKGLWGKPTVLNNVETFANIPIIIHQGADWYAAMGTETSKGTKVFSLVGNIVNTGLIEVEMGTTLRQIIYDIGGGIPGGKQFKAVQTGGPSGGCLPADKLDMPVDYEQLKQAGSIMGSGGMIVMDESACIVNVAKYFIEFCNDESCGKCVSCRDGSTALLEILERISNGKGREDDIELMKDLCYAITDASLCGLGKSLANPVLSTLQYFNDEYLAHIRDKTCPAKVCKPLFQYKVSSDNCKKCGLCFKNCPADAIIWKKKEAAEIIQDKCVKCGICVEVCKSGAIE
ncbi:MAG: 4Fe-4S binding protein [Deltaproteobacteria bacterium]|nr:4Fe-4S binding protein [Deltaproteobacteria bacterium]